MKVHLNQIPADGLHVEGTEDHDILQLNDPLIEAVSPVDYALDIGLSDGGLFATGSLEVELEMECVRCLEKFQRALRLEHFALQLELTGPEMIDLTPTMREDIVLALPTHPHCDWDGTRICPGVPPATVENDLADLNDTNTASSAPKAWDALDKLQIRSRN